MTFEQLGIKATKQGIQYMPCPVCGPTRRPENRKKECLTVNNEVGNRWYKCHNCTFHGNLETMDKYEKVYAEAKIPKEQKVYSQAIVNFLHNKGLTPDTAIKCGCYERTYKNKAGEVEYVLCYPYFVRHSLRNVMFRRVLYVQGVSEGPREWQISKEKAPTELVFWGLDDYDPEHPECIIVEGQTDRMTWVQAGYKNVLSIPAGALNVGQIPEKKLDFINDEFRDITKTCKKYIIVMDNDAPGIYTKGLIASKIGKQKCYYVTYPFGNYKDSNEVYAGNTAKSLEPKLKEGIDQMYRSASPFPLEGLIVLKDIREQFNLYVSQGGPKRGYITGDSTSDLDENLSIREKMLMAVTGIPSMGKSTWVRWYCTKLSETNPQLRWGMFTPENRPVEREYMKLQECFLQKKITGRYAASMDEQMQAYNFVSDHFFVVAPEKKNFHSFDKDARPKSLKNLFGYFLTLRDQYGITGFVIDAWNKIEHARPSGMQTEEYIGLALDTVLDFLDMNDMMGIIVAHPYKMEVDRKTKNYHVPTMYDIKGSSAWYERVDLGVSIHRYKYKKDKDTKEFVVDKYAPTYVDINKMKFEELGNECTITQFLDWRNGNVFTGQEPNYYHAPTPMEKLVSPSYPSVTTLEETNEDDVPF